MHVAFRNIGMIREASLDLNGLCVIAGENDTSKSAVGKTLFSLIKSFQGPTDQNQEKKLEDFKVYLNALFSGEFINRYIDEPGRIIVSGPGEGPVANLKMNGELSVQLAGELPFRDAAYVENPNVLRLAGFLPLSESMAARTPRDDREARLLSLLFPPHIQDLLGKLREPEKLATGETLEFLARIIRGNVRYDPEVHDFLYRKKGADGENEAVYRSLNMAAGVKAFGVLEVLYRAGRLNQDLLLILDEPEVHLHPKWQLRYAELLARLTREVGLTVLLTSHSPYFLEALALYSEVHELKDRSSFYLARLNEDGLTSALDNVTDHLEDIFDALNEPFQELEKLSMDLV